MTYSNQFPIREKPKVGKLWYDDRLLMSDKPFAKLQHEKKRLLATGYYKKELFKITY